MIPECSRRAPGGWSLGWVESFVGKLPAELKTGPLNLCCAVLGLGFSFCARCSYLIPHTRRLARVKVYACIPAVLPINIGYQPQVEEIRNGASSRKPCRHIYASLDNRGGAFTSCYVVQENSTDQLALAPRQCWECMAQEDEW